LLRLKSKPKHISAEFAACSHSAKTVPMQAKCVSRLLKDQITGKRYMKMEKVSLIGINILT
jgi:hypothetical protein